MGLPNPDINLGVDSTSPITQISEMMRGVGLALEQMASNGQKSSLVLVHGDTNSALAGALTANKMGIPVAHVEAGTRCWDMSVPEEVNRIMIDALSTLLFCPTEMSMENLDGLHNPADALIEFTGDVLYDMYLSHNHVEPTDNLGEILDAIIGMGKSGMKIMFPVHPRTESRLSSGARTALRGSVTVVEPLNHTETLSCIAGTGIVLTDSGGVQREAYFAGKPCICIGSAVWRELWLACVCMPVPASKEAIIKAVIFKESFSKPEFVKGLFGDGDAVEKIAQNIRKREDKNGQ